MWAVLALVGCGLGAVPVGGQETMEVRFYLLPAMRVGHMRGPMYLKWRMDPDGLDVNYWQIYYGQLDVMVICVEAEAADQSWLSAQDGVYTFPANLDTTPSPAELSVLETSLEGLYIPADWLLPNMTWRGILRTVTGIMWYMGRLTTEYLGGQSPVDLGWTLNTQFKTLSAAHQAAILGAFDSLGYDSSAIKANWTLRIVLKNAADQFGTTPIQFGDIITL